MRVLVLGAEHPDEKESTEAVESLISDPLPNVKGLLANLEGIRLGKRVVDENMVRAYANADPNSNKYERRRAAEVLAEIESENPDVVVSLHNPGLGTVRFAALDPTRGVNPQVLGMLYGIGIRHIIKDDSGIVAHRTNAVLIEIPKAEIRHGGVGIVRQFIDNLANGTHLPTADVSRFKWFIPSKIGGGALHKDVIHPDELSPEERDSIQPFERVPRIIEERLGSTVPLYLTSIPRPPNDQGFWSETLEEDEAPDSSHWPR